MHDQEAAKLRMEQARKKAREERAEREEKERQIEEVKKQLPHLYAIKEMYLTQFYEDFNEDLNF